MAGKVPARLKHIERQIPPLAHTPMYVWHKFWGRKTWNVVSEYIKTYCPEDGIVFDPFCGSGVVAIEALRAGRKAIVCDLLPIATEITRLTCKPVNTTKLLDAFERLSNRIREQILQLYETRCRKCRHVFPFSCAVWEKGRCSEIRYRKCPQCGDRQEKDCPPNSTDRALLRKIEGMRPKAWYPRDKLYYPNGAPFVKKEHYESLDELFTKRNLIALAWLMGAIEEEPDRELVDFLKIAFTSMVHLVSRMVPVSDPSGESEGHHTYFSSPGWIQHSYWYAEHFKEQNVWERFESAVKGHQGLLKAKIDSNQALPVVRFASHLEDVLEGRADIYIHCGDCIDLSKKMIERHGPCVDYIFTDPPYDASVQYGELSFLWVAWLGKDTGYLNRLLAKEIIRNKQQNKTFDVYKALIRNAFKKMYDVLKPDKYLTLTFHNPSFEVRNSTISAGVVAGLEFEKIHHQPLGQVSAKAMLQPFGSAQGDFYLRFHKSSDKEMPATPEDVDATRFERIVVETAKRVIAERGEETPYTILINAIDPELAQNGYFSQLRSGLDINAVLQNHLGNEFRLVPMKIGSAEGKGWWFQDPSRIAHLESVPLSERVEQTVLRKLQTWGRVTFTDMWKAVSEEFPNALTADSTSIREALAIYARPVGRSGEWLLQPEYNQLAIRRDHTRMVVILAEMGKAQGYEIWVGRREQRDRVSEGFPGREGELKQYVSRSSLQGVEKVVSTRDVENIDVLWLEGDAVKVAFEVESTTSMTEALKRGSSLDSNIPKYLVIPQDREGQLQRKCRSPLFGDRFEKDSWNYIFFDALNDAFSSRRRVRISTLVGKRTAGGPSHYVTDERQLTFFGDDS